MSQALTPAGGPYSYELIHQVINTTADDLIEAAELPDSGVVDVINFLVSATLQRLAEPGRSFQNVALSYGLTDYQTNEPLPGKQALETIVAWMHQ